MDKGAEQVTITIDDREVTVPKGMNLIDAAASVGIEIPHYCYHPNLSIAGNCRMCQVEIGGSPKLGIACNTTCSQGLNVRTHNTSHAVAESQRATLEFLLINHPLDCTVCDQAGHCKLQDYYYDYNSRPSRFIEDKVDKVKAEPLGPEVVYDGERCIMCTRCVRFCSEVTGTSELGAFNRGDRGVIGVFPGEELDNPLSGTVVDLCPVGALTHRKWRFNTRIWYSSESESVCPGCSTGCNMKAAIRDDRVVHVKARMNSAVNKEWMCDEGRYGVERFQPTERLTQPLVKGADGHRPVSLQEGIAKGAASLKGGADGAVVFLSPFLAMEDLWVAVRFAEKVMGIAPGSERLALGYRGRELTEVERVLISPDYSPNARAAEYLGIISGGDGWREQLAERYRRALEILRGGVSRVLLVGDLAIYDEDLDQGAERSIAGAQGSVALTPSAPASRRTGFGTIHGAHANCSVLLPSRTTIERDGVMVNQAGRVQRVRTLVSPPFGSIAEWNLLLKLGKAAGASLLPDEVIDERAVYREMAKAIAPLNGLTLMNIGAQGMPLPYVPEAAGSDAGGVQEARV